jgi:hypothetical protein
MKKMFEVVTAVGIQANVISVMTPCSLVDGTTCPRNLLGPKDHNQDLTNRMDEMKKLKQEKKEKSMM